MQQTSSQYQQPPQIRTQAPADDLDSLLNELGGAGAPPPRQAASQYQPSPTTSAYPPQRQTQSQYQAPPSQRTPAPALPPADDLDSLLNELGGSAGAPVSRPPPSQQQPQRAPSQIAAPKGGDDLDSLLNELGGSAPRPQSQAQNSMYGRASVAAAPPSTVNKGRPTAPSSGDDLDSLLNELGGPSAAPAPRPQQQQQQQPPVRAPSQIRPPPSGGDDLDSLLNELGGSAPPPQANRSTYSQAPNAAAAAARPTSTKGGDDLDSLLNELGSSAGAAPISRSSQPSLSQRTAAPPRAAPAASSSDDLESLLNELGGPASQAPSQRSTLSGSRPVTAAARGGAGGDEDLDLMLKGLSNQMMNIDDATPAARGVCNYCRKPILGEVIQAMNKAFHPEHFICNNCQEPLGTRNFYEQEGHPHCENCYQSLFCARCAHCNKPVLDRCITAMGKKVLSLFLTNSVLSLSFLTVLRVSGISIILSAESVTLPFPMECSLRRKAVPGVRIATPQISRIAVPLVIKESWAMSSTHSADIGTQVEPFA